MSTPPPPPPANPHAAALVLFPGGEFCTDCGHVTGPSGPGARYSWWKTSQGTPNLDTIALVLHWMAQEDYPPRDLAYAVEKPWKFTEEFLATVRACAPDEEDSEAQELLAPEEQPRDLLKALVLSMDRHRAGRRPKG